MITIHSISGPDETTLTLLSLAKSFREKPDRKGAHTDIMKVVAERVLRNDAKKLHIDAKDLPF